jgi:hypothetical protein
MKSLFRSLLIGATVLLAACGDKEGAKPTGPVPVSVRLENVGSDGSKAVAFVRETSLFNPGTGKLIWSHDLDPATHSLGSMERGKKVVLIVMYDAVDRAGYVRPQAGHYIKAELSADGKVLGTARAELSDFNNQSNYWQEPGGGKHLVKETQITIQ